MVISNKKIKSSKKSKSYKRFKSSNKPKSSKKLLAFLPQNPKWKLPLAKNTIDYKNVVLLRKSITAEGKILPRRISGVNAKQQREIAKAIKNCRMVGLLPFITKTK